MAEIDISKHALVPKHSKCSEKEKKEILDKYGLSLTSLPCIMPTDPAIIPLDVKEGDVIKIMRKSPTAGESIFYRRVL